MVQQVYSCNLKVGDWVELCPIKIFRKVKTIKCIGEILSIDEGGFEMKSYAIKSNSELYFLENTFYFSDKKGKGTIITPKQFLPKQFREGVKKGHHFNLLNEQDIKKFKASVLLREIER